MKNKVISILVLVCVCVCAGICYAERAIPYELEKRIYFSYDRCFIVKDDGTVFMNNAAKKLYPDVMNWVDIQAISVGFDSVVGLKKDGTVVASGGNSFNKVHNVSEWKDVVEIATDIWCVYGLNKEGELLYTGEIPDENKETFNKYEWKNLIHIVADSGYLFAITNDGRVISTYDDDLSQLEGVQHMIAEDMGVDFIHDDGSWSFFTIYGGGFVFVNKDEYILAQVSTYSNDYVCLDIYGQIHASEFSPYYQLDADNIIAVCGGIYVDKDGILYSIEDIDADEPLPTFDLNRYQ